MTTDNTPTSPEPGPDAGTDDIQADIEHTRAEVGETIEMLSAKADVPGRAKQKVAETAEHVAEKAAEAKDAAVSKAHHAFDHDSDEESSTPPVGALIGVAAALAVGVLVWRRRRR